MPTVPDTVYRLLPAVHEVLASERLAGAVAASGHGWVADACRRVLDDLRRRIAAGEIDAATVAGEATRVPDAVLAELERLGRPAYPAVVNATGVLLHTNLGRAPLPPVPDEVVGGYLALEYDLAAGRRGQRLAPLRRRLAELFGAESALMVNNNAAALVLILSGLARDREVIVSRGQLIEIGDSFRLPDVMAASGARLVEVGCTNRTHLRDVEAAIGEATAAVLVAHQSNFRMVGFTTQPGTAALAALCHAWNLPLIVDQGSGCLYDLERWGLPHEETVAELLAGGADLVCCSGDKLIGGPQAGIVVGRRRWLEPLARHPLYRALRPDKAALVWMDRVLRSHREGRLADIPLYAMLEIPLPVLRRRAASMARRLREAGVPARSTAMRAVVGGGTTPGSSVASHGLAVAGGQALADALRASAPPVITRLEEDRVLLDLRTVRPDQERVLLATLIRAYGSASTRQDGGR